MASHVPAKQKIQRDEISKLKVEASLPLINIKSSLILLIQVIVVGAGLGGLGAAIAILLAGHNVTVLESASEIAEVVQPIIHPSLPRILKELRSEPVSKSSPTAVMCYKHGA